MLVNASRRWSESKTETHNGDRRRRRGAWHRCGAGAECLPEEPGVLLHAFTGRRQRGAAGSHLSHRRHGGPRQPEARGRQRRVHGDRHGKEHARDLPRPAAGPVPRRQGRGGAGTARRRRHVPRQRSPRQARRELHAARGRRCGEESPADGTENMTHELGQFALCLALIVALAQSFFPLLGASRRDFGWMALARPAAQAQALLVAFAFGCLTYAFVANDFSVAYVAMHSNTALPLHYRIAGVWGGHEGSLLLWALMLGVWMTAVSLFSTHLPEEIVARVLGVMGLVSAGFLAFLLFTSNPFDRLLPPAADGRGLNPLLQDPGIGLHPPVLYMGYVGFSVAFAFAVAALLSGRLDATWARWSRPWTTVAWAFLTVGIALGSGWAYYELGWGGWWFWDPVENASFMPWLVGTALIHSVAVTEKRGAFRSWTVLLAILAFALPLLGTFLVRSGVLTSVHAFATDPARGIFILALLVVVIGGSLLLYVWRAPKIGLGGGFEPLSRESMLLANNVMFAAAAGSVLLGTLYPLALRASGLGKISVGPPYFETVFVPLMAPALFLMGVGPLARWKKASIPDLATRLRWAFAASLAAGLVLPFAMGRWSALVAFGMLLAAWVAASGVVQLYEKIRNAAGRTSAWD